MTVLSGAVGSPARAANIIDEWANVKAPPAAGAQAGDGRSEDHGAVDARFPAARSLLRRRQAALRRHAAGDEESYWTEARAKGATVIYSVAGKFEASDIVKDVAPAANEPLVKSKADKFLNTDLEKILKDKGIQTVIVTGTAANGAVLYTGTGAALRGSQGDRSGRRPLGR